jgi:SpoIID/LytB domain protein
MSLLWAACAEPSRLTGALAQLSLPLHAEEDALQAYYDGALEESAAGFEEILRVKKDTVSVKRQLAVIYSEMGDLDRVAALLGSIWEDQGNDPELRRELFVTDYLAGAYEKAAALLPLDEEAPGEVSPGETIFYEALLQRALGNAEGAVELLRKSLELNDSRPAGWFYLGELLAAGAPAEAEACFKKCLEQDSTFSAALFPLGKVLFDQKSYRSAYTYLSQAHDFFPYHEEITAALNTLQRVSPQSTRSGGAAAPRQRISANPPKVTPLGRAGESLPQVRIGLAERRSLVSVKTGGAYTIRTVGTPAVLYTGKDREQIWVEFAKGSLSVQDADGKNLARSTRPVILEYAAKDNTSIVSGAAAGNRTYRGALEFRPMEDGLTVVNCLNLEEYLYGVTPSEMPSFWPAEALKAQTIAARSYCLANLGKFADKGFDLYGSPLSQAYGGVGKETRATNAAVDATRGMILRGGDKTLDAYYSANHGGYSEDSQSVWGYDAYMAAVPDKKLSPRTRPLPLDELNHWIRDRPDTYSSVPHFHYSSSFRWERWVSAAEIRRRLLADADIGEVTQILSRGRGISGRISDMEIRGVQGTVNLKSDDIRTRLGGLRSNLFSIRPVYDRQGKVEFFIFQGAGYGHGVGMDQHGAAGMASAGFSAEEILQHYYPRAEIAKGR